MLSKYHPVGVMIFGNAELLGVPWQVMIKEFRKKELGDTHYPTLQEYGNRLIGHINNNHKYFPPEKQNKFFIDTISDVFESISRQITADVREITVKGRKITATEISSIIERHILTAYETLLELEDLTTLPKYSYRQILKKYKNDIDAKIQNHFQFLKPTDYLSKILRRISGLLFIKNTFDITGNYSGIVVAGFGEDEIYGNIIEYNIDEPLEQFAQVVEHFKLKLPAEFFTRCLVCNSLLKSASAEEIAANAPPRIRASQEEFSYCPNCEKIYWEGSHTRRMRTAVEDVFNRLTKLN